MSEQEPPLPRRWSTDAQVMQGDIALIPGDIVRRCDAAIDGALAKGEHDPDAMGMVTAAEVLLDLAQLEGPERPVLQGVSASSLHHLVPIRFATWVVHHTDGWLGRVQSWDEDLILRFSAAGAQAPCRCLVRAANQKRGIGITDSFCREFFPGLVVSISTQDLRSGALACEWLDGDAARAVAGAAASSQAHPERAPPPRVEATIEEVRAGEARVEWLTQVPLPHGRSTERPPSPRARGQEDKLLLLTGEAERASRWALGDRLWWDGALCEVRGVETRMTVRWQNGSLSVGAPARELQLCNPDAFSFFPSELVCRRTAERPAGPAAPHRCGAPSAAAPPGAAAAAPPRSNACDEEAARGPAATAPETLDAGAGQPGERSPHGSAPGHQGSPKIGFVVRADPASRMVGLRWLDQGGPGPEEEWSAFDLQIDPEFGYRLGDAVILSCDWERPPPHALCSEPAATSGAEGRPCAPRVGQVTALEVGSVHVRWLDGSASLHAPRELYRVGDEEEEDEGSLAGSQGAAPEGSRGSQGGDTGAHVAELPRAIGDLAPPTAGSADATESCPGLVGEDGQPRFVPPAAPPDAPPWTRLAGSRASAPSALAAPGAAGAPAAASAGGLDPAATGAGAPAEAEEAGEISLEDMAWEPHPQDHHFAHSPPHPAGPSCRQFMMRAQREWNVLRRGLPSSIWVHMYPDRMELLRACLIGPEGTPYSDALFFFDVYLPPTYPLVPPQVKFWSFGESLNPNLYENGKVCLSLLGTWAGRDSETWSPGRSNLLQVLVSLLGLVLNAEPYYNEPGFERERGTPQGDLRSLRYNESVALSSYHLMLAVLQAPPCDFARPIRSHFAERRAAVLARAGRLQSGEEGRCSEGFRRSLAALLPRLGAALPQAPPPAQ